MWTKIKQLLAPPVFGDENQDRVAKLLNAVLLIFFGFGLLINIILPIMDPGGSYYTSLLLLLIILGLLVYIRRGGYQAVQISSVIFSLAILALVTLNSWTDGGLRNMATTTYFLLIVIAGLLLGGRGAVVFGVLSILAAWILWYGEANGLIVFVPRGVEFQDWFKFALILGTVLVLIRFAINNLTQAIDRTQQAVSESQQLNEQIQEVNEYLEQEIATRMQSEEELQAKLETIEAQQLAIKELSTPVIPITDQIIVMPLVGSIDTLRARDVTRSLLSGISEHQAKVVIVDITGVSVVDTGVVNYLNKTIQAARLKGARTIVTGISDAVAETIVELGIDWSNIETLRDLQTGLVVALNSFGIKFAG